MTSDEQSRPGDDSQAAHEAFSSAGPDRTDRVAVLAMPRPRCLACGHVLASPRSLSRGFGPVCWHRTALVQLDRRRDVVGRRLASLARRIPALDAAALEDLGERLEALAGRCSA